MAQLLDRIPLRAGECTVIGALLFHGPGLSQFIMSLALGSACVVRRRFAPEATLRQVEKYRATALVLVPTMLHRILGLGDELLRSDDTSSLRIILVAGGASHPGTGQPRHRGAAAAVPRRPPGSCEPNPWSVPTVLLNEALQNTGLFFE